MIYRFGVKHQEREFEFQVDAPEGHDVRVMRERLQNALLREGFLNGAASVRGINQ